MKTIPICPDCGQPALEVNEKAVSHNLKKPKKIKEGNDKKWYACINPGCECSYFTAAASFKISDITIPLFYKDNSDDAVICYCAGLKRGEIRKAVKAGCSSAGEVRKFTKKTGSGNCEKKNPLGKCCKPVLARTIKEMLDSKKRVSVSAGLEEKEPE